MAQLVRFVAKMVAVGVFGGPDYDPDGISARKCVKTQKITFILENAYKLETHFWSFLMFFVIVADFGPKIGNSGLWDVAWLQAVLPI